MAINICVLLYLKEADYLLCAMVALSYRYQLVDFPASWYYSPFGTLVPYPAQNVNLFASFQPFSYQVSVEVKHIYIHFF